jgi:hypothetical protein
MKKVLFAKFGTAFVLLVMLLCIGNAMAFGYAAWEDDRFDGFQLGSLNGKNGWTGTVNAQIVTDDRYSNGYFKVLYINPSSGQTITNSKTVDCSAHGNLYMDLRVRVDNADPLQPTLAKLAIFTNGGMKFQVYFGANLRLNYSDNPEDKYYLVSSTESGRWYWIHLELDLENLTCDAYVDGIKIDPTLQGKTNAIQPGTINGIVITGWDRPGEVYLDDIYGIKRVSF